MIKYEEALKDWQYLFETIGYADDMTGAYEDSRDLYSLLKAPTKRTARDVLENQIAYWFQRGVEYTTEHRGKSISDLILEFPEITEIAAKRWIGLSNCPIPFCRNSA